MKNEQIIPPPADNQIPEDLKNGILAFGAVCAACGQRELATIFGTVTNAIEKDALSDLTLSVAIFAKRNGLDGELDFSKLEGVRF